MGWRGESRRHALAARGIKTVNEPPKYSRKSIDNMSREELAIEVEKAFYETIYEYAESFRKEYEEQKEYYTSYEKFLEHLKEKGGINHQKTPYGTFDVGAYATFEVDPSWSEKEIKEFLKKKKEDWPVEDKYGFRPEKDLADIQIFKDKQMTTHSGDYGYVAGYEDKPENSNVLLTVTYDGAGYDFFSYEAEYGGGLLRKKFEEKLKEKFGKKVMWEDYTTWAGQVYDNRGDY